jgi:hypothetical protein
LVRVPKPAHYGMHSLGGSIYLTGAGFWYSAVADALGGHSSLAETARCYQDYSFKLKD